MVVGTNVRPVHGYRQKSARDCDRQRLPSIVGVLVPDQQRLAPTFVDFRSPSALLPPDGLLQPDEAACNNNMPSRTELIGCPCERVYLTRAFLTISIKRS